MNPILDLCKNKDEQLLDVLFEAQASAARNNQNASSVAVKMAGMGSGSFDKAVIAAICMIGSIHAPVSQTRELMFDRDIETIEGKIIAIVQNGGKVPGFGNSFYKDSIDPSFLNIAEYINSNYERTRNRIFWAGVYVEKATGTLLFPNAAMFTAATADILGFPKGVESLLFIASRLPVWAEIFISKTE